MCVDQRLKGVEGRQLERDMCCRERYHLVKEDLDVPVVSQPVTYCDETHNTTRVAYRHRNSSCSEAMFGPRSDRK